jgi:hypothetical protein
MPVEAVVAGETFGVGVAAGSYGPAAPVAAGVVRLAEVAATWVTADGVKAGALVLGYPEPLGVALADDLNGAATPPAT